MAFGACPYIVYSPLRRGQNGEPWLWSGLKPEAKGSTIQICFTIITMKAYLLILQIFKSPPIQGHPCLPSSVWTCWSWKDAVPALSPVDQNTPAVQLLLLWYYCYCNIPSTTNGTNQTTAPFDLLISSVLVGRTLQKQIKIYTYKTKKNIFIWLLFEGGGGWSLHLVVTCWCKLERLEKLMLLWF